MIELIHQRYELNLFRTCSNVCSLHMLIQYIDILIFLHLYTLK